MTRVINRRVYMEAKERVEAYLQKMNNELKEEGDLFHAIMDICGDVQLNGKDHLDATSEILVIVEKYYTKENSL
jgi:hypothetical protein